MDIAKRFQEVFRCQNANGCSSKRKRAVPAGLPSIHALSKRSCQGYLCGVSSFTFVF